MENQHLIKEDGLETQQVFGNLFLYQGIVNFFTEFLFSKIFCRETLQVLTNFIPFLSPFLFLKIKKFYNKNFFEIYFTLGECNRIFKRGVSFFHSNQKLSFLITKFEIFFLYRNSLSIHILSIII